MNADRWPEIQTRFQVERARQEELKAQGKFPYTCADAGLGHLGCLAVLVEEVGEAARALLQLEHYALPDGVIREPLAYADAVRRLRSELIQVGAVTLAWLEGLEEK